MDLHLNGLWCGGTAVGCVACSLCMHTLELAVSCVQDHLSEGAVKLSGTASQSEQRAKSKFMCKPGKSGAEMLQALQSVYRDNALKKKTGVCDW